MVHERAGAPRAPAANEAPAPLSATTATATAPAVATAASVPRHHARPFA